MAVAVAMAEGPGPGLVILDTLAGNAQISRWPQLHVARAAAQERLDRSVEAMRAAGMTVRGEVGDGDPVQAIEDALRTFAPDELVISTHPEGRSHWLERGVVAAARERFALPVTHVVVDLGQVDAETAAAAARSDA